MKKILISFAVITGLVACSSSFDYYNGGINYYQDGLDCVYTVSETGDNFSNKIDSLSADRKIVYKNTICADLFASDSFNAMGNRQVSGDNCSKCVAQPKVHKNDDMKVCSKCQTKTMYLKRRYVIVSEM